LLKAQSVRDQGRAERALALYGELVDRFALSAEPRVQTAVSNALNAQADLLAELDRLQQAVEVPSPRRAPTRDGLPPPSRHRPRLLVSGRPRLDPAHRGLDPAHRSTPALTGPHPEPATRLPR
jgi:hypothetical protein